ncbi:MAG: hypothetical protein PHH28_04745 [Desulfuromonadaceae bacterium]|nr:hypothetical protein [Desulfuromonadaceae bacterium]
MFEPLSFPQYFRCWLAVYPSPSFFQAYFNLLALGTQLGTALRAGLNRSGPWAMSRRLAAHTGLTNKCLKDQGLLSVKELWVKIHYPATAR